MATKKVIDMTARSTSTLSYDDYLYLTGESPNIDEKMQASVLRDYVLSGIKTSANSGLAQTSTPYAAANPEYELKLDANNLDIATGTIGLTDYIVIEAVGSGLTKKMTAANVLAAATSAVTSVNGGDGITVSPTTGATAVEVDLKANGGLVIESGEVAVDLAASSITGTLADGDIASAATWNAKQAALTFGIADTNSVVIDSASVADNDYAKFTSSGLEGRTASETKTDLSLDNVENTALSTWAGSTNITTLGTVATGTWNATALGDSYISSAATWNAKQNALTFGIADTNSVVIDSASVANNDYAKFTASGLEGRTASETKTDLSLDNVENTALSTWTGSTNVTTLGTVATGTWEGTAVAVDQGGTGQTSYTNGQLLIGNTTGNTLSKATLTAGSNITITEGAGSITIAAASGGDPAGTAVAMAIALGG